jgi:hypothetical protein
MELPPPTMTTTPIPISASLASDRAASIATWAIAGSRMSQRRLAPKAGAWAIAGGWFDYNNDGLLELFVADYLK